MENAWDGKRLRELREANEQSQGDIAHALAVWPNTVSRWETGRAVPVGKFRRKLVEIYPGLAL